MCKRLIFILLFLLSVSACKKQETKIVKKEVATNSIQVTKVSKVSLASGELRRVDSFPSKYITPRPIDVWLPDGYSDSKKYKVLYMHDGLGIIKNGKPMSGLPNW